MDPIQAITAGMEMTGIEPEDSHSSHPGDSSATPPPSANLDSLPFDIQRMIVWDEELSQEDVASLRLTCRGLVLSTSTRLFYRIAISKLHADRESFLSICRNPGLAKHVYEVEWCEISWDVSYFDRITSISTRGDVDDDADLDDICRYFHGQAEAAFWLPNVPFTDNAGDVDLYDVARQEREEAVTGFKETFMAAIDQLPNLHTFVSRPMTSTRTINPEGDYPMNASLFYTFQDMGRKWCEASQANDGLFLFIFPAMVRANSTVRRLRWADEFPGYSYVRPVPALAFEGLESLDLCWTPFNPADNIDNPSLSAACFTAAPTLRHLSLCLEHGSSDASPGYVEHEILGPNLAASTFATLHSLRLVSLNLIPDALLEVMKKNASTLRHMYLESVGLTADILPRMAEIPGLRLSTMEVVGEERPHEDPCAILRYVNGQSSGPDDLLFNDIPVHQMIAGDSLRLHDLVTTPLPDSITDPGNYSDNPRAALQENSDTCRAKSPRWVWGRFYHKSSRGDIYAYQVPPENPHGHRTTCWKFTSRHGEFAYGNNPLTWFDEWDVNAGDVEEPTPYSPHLQRFASKHKRKDTAIPSFLGEGSACWNLIANEKPPEGAILYDDKNDPLDDWGGYD